LGRAVGLGLRLAPSPEQDQHADRDAHDDHADQRSQPRREAAEGQPDQHRQAEAEGEHDDDQNDEQEDSAEARHETGTRRWRDEAHGPQQEELAARGRLLAHLLHGVAQLVRAALGEGERRLHHLSQRRPLLRMHAGHRLVEVGLGGRDVVALGCAGAEDGLGRHTVLGLALELLVGARLE